MIVKIVKGGTHSFVINYKGDIGINIAPGADMIEVFQWVNHWFLNDKKECLNVKD